MYSDGFGMPKALEQARWVGPKLVFLPSRSPLGAYKNIKIVKEDSKRG